ncbi:MAG: hypothetical protein H0X25_20985, partial [Acidobacteriales bacterium]|nr:hypothetical protein [Terriglobales bacterium]
VQLWDTHDHEIGPAVVRPDGTVWATGSNLNAPGHSAVFNPSTRTWTAGPDFPGTNDIADGPAALEPNGLVLVPASPGQFKAPTTFYEYSDATGLVAAPAPSGASSLSSYVYRFIVLPTGQIMETDGTSTVQIYTPVGNPDPSWAPAVTTVASSLTRGTTYGLKGTQLNGLSEAGAYGDDAQASTNYPLVRVTNNASGHVQYFRTHDPSSRSIAPEARGQVKFDVPATAETGASSLVVVANGNPSSPVAVTIK